MIEVKEGDVVVSSSDSRANREVAETVARVLSRNWLEGSPQDEPVYFVAQYEGHGIIYEARIVKVN